MDTDRPRSPCRGRSPERRSRERRSCCLLAWWRPGHECGRTVMKSPECPVTVEDIVVATHELYVPSVFTQQDEDDVADRGRLVVTPCLQNGVEDEVTLGAPGRPFRVRLTEGLMPGVHPHSRDLADTVGAEGGDDVIGPPVVQRLRVDRQGGPHPFGHVGKRRAHGSLLPLPQNPRSTTGRSRGFTFTARRAVSSS